MAKIYRQTYRQSLSEEKHIAECPYAVLRDLFDLTQAKGSHNPPTFGDPPRESRLAEEGYARKTFWIVIKLSEAEVRVAKEDGLDHRYYKMDISPEEAKSRIATGKRSHESASGN